MISQEKVAKMIVDISCLDDLNTVIIVTHDITQACSVADHLWLLGRERDASGKVIEGARMVETYDLVERGLCWQENITTRADFVSFVRTVKERFRTL
jgi:polar amino acid transport system ATP-binding protein/sulfate transport system ATP-binding protein